MEVYDETLTIQAALAQLFERFGFAADAYTAKWFAIYVGKFQVWLPNIPARVKVARFHDIHHVLTGYPANWRGESEIGAWELATGCRTSAVAWFLNGGRFSWACFYFREQFGGHSNGGGAPGRIFTTTLITSCF